MQLRLRARERQDNAGSERLDVKVCDDTDGISSGRTWRYEPDRASAVGSSVDQQSQEPVIFFLSELRVASTEITKVKAEDEVV